MEFSFLTYNTLFNNGFENIKTILDLRKPDIICFQEINTSENNLKKMTKYGYRLAGYENSFIRLGTIYGIATFYNEKAFKTIQSTTLKQYDSSVLGLIYNILGVFLGYNRHKSFLLTNFFHKKTGKKVSVCNTHLFVIGSNALRIKHINKVLKTLQIGGKKHFIISGDFNYLPYQRKKLEKFMKKFHLKESTQNVYQTVKFTGDDFLKTLSTFQKLSTRVVNAIFKNLKIDYTFYKGIKLKKTERIEASYSDHYPILSVFKI